MKLPQTGGCQCGAIRYEITEEPQLVYTCHCTDWTIRPGYGRRATFGPAANRPGSRFPRAMRCSRRSLPRDGPTGKDTHTSTAFSGGI